MSDATNVRFTDDYKVLLTRTLRRLLIRWPGCKQSLWAIVTEVCAIGSTHANQLCEDLGLDPDEQSSGVEAMTDEEYDAEFNAEVAAIPVKEMHLTPDELIMRFGPNRLMQVIAGELVHIMRVYDENQGERASNATRINNLSWTLHDPDTKERYDLVLQRAGKISPSEARDIYKTALEQIVEQGSPQTAHDVKIARQALSAGKGEVTP